MQLILLTKVQNLGNLGDKVNVKPASPEKKAKKKSSDLGRALRSVYDDTLRESVPDEFLNLLGRLS